MYNKIFNIRVDGKRYCVYPLYWKQILVMNVCAIIQARTGSTRLPNKVMKPINGKPMISYSYERLKQCKNIDKVIVATTDLVGDNIIEKYCVNNNILYFRGNSDDLLDRYYRCAKKFNADIIVRITSDCPLIDPRIVDKAINAYVNNAYRYDIVRNTWEIGLFPSGFDCEVFSIDLLEEEWTNNKDVKSREHVMSRLYNDPKIKVLAVGVDPEYTKRFLFNYEELHLSVDTEEDYVVIKTIIEGLCSEGLSDFTFDDVMNYLDRVETVHLVDLNMDNNRIEKFMAVKKSVKSNVLIVYRGV